MKREVKSKTVEKYTGIRLIEKIILLIKQAGAPREDTYDRDGFLSYKSESHSVGSGIGIGFMIGASGRLSILGAILTLILYGNRGEFVIDTALIKDILSELHYFLPSLVMGVIIGLLIRLVLNLEIPMM